MNISILFLAVCIVSTMAVTMYPQTSTGSNGGQTTKKISEKLTSKIPMSRLSQQTNKTNITIAVLPLHGNTTTVISGRAIATKYIAPTISNIVLLTSTIPTQTYEKMNITTEKIGLVVANQTDKKNKIAIWDVRNIVQIPTIQKNPQICPDGLIRNINGDCVQDANGYN